MGSRGLTPTYLGHRTGLLARIVARLRGHAIDSRLLSGELPSDSAETARFVQLLDRGHRSRVAGELRRLIDAAHRPWRDRYGPSVPMQWEEVLKSEPLILNLAQELEGLDEVNPRGVILTSRLLRDGDSPVFAPSSEVDLEMAVKHAKAALLLG